VTTSYDDVAYDSEANADTHPIAMATLATVAGVEGVASAKKARVLEIGCGDGTNLIRMASYLPDAKFVGFDLAKTAIESGRKIAPPNVDLFAADIMAVKVDGPFDYVIAHGMVSWVPDPVRKKLFALMSESLSENGVGFVSANALPGWEPRRALRELALSATRGVEDPAKKVKQALEAIANLPKQKWRASSFGAGLAKSAADYLDHVKRATPPDSPFERYVFHDLLAPINVPFSKEQLEVDDLHVVSETPLGLPPDSPFVQVLLSKQSPTKRKTVEDLYLWADFTKTGRAGEYKTTTGALLKPIGDDGLAKAIALAPGFVKVRDLTTNLDQFCAQLEAGWRDGVLTLLSEPPEVPKDLAPEVKRAIAEACERKTSSVVITNALHRSFKIPRKEIEALHDDKADEELRDRLRRHLFVAP
jgi:SAM-dependent methyltransferase